MNTTKLALLFFSAHGMIFRLSLFGFKLSLWEITGIITFVAILVTERIRILKPSLFLYMIFIVISCLGAIKTLTLDDYGLLQALKGVIVDFLFLIFLIACKSVFKKTKIETSIHVIHCCCRIFVVVALVQLLFQFQGASINQFLAKVLPIDMGWQSFASCEKFGPFFRLVVLGWDPNFTGYSLLLILVLLRERRGVLGFESFVVIVLIFFSLSLSVLLGLFSYLLVLAVSSKADRHRTLLMLLILMSLLLAMYVNNPYFRTVIRYKFNLDADINSSFRSHKEFIYKGVEMFSARPILGLGLNTFSSYARKMYGKTQVKLHNAFLQIGVERGFFALLLWMLSYFFYVFEEAQFTNRRFFLVLSLVVPNIAYDFMLYPQAWLAVLSLGQQWSILGEGCADVFLDSELSKMI